MAVQGRRTAMDHITVHFNRVETAPQTDHHRPQPAIPYDQVRPDAHWKNRILLWQLRQKFGQILPISRLEHRIRGPPHTQPCEIRQRAVQRQAPAGSWKSHHLRLS